MEKTCKFCNKPSGDGDQCNACWEVTSRLDVFLSTVLGREHVREALGKATSNAHEERG